MPESKNGVVEIPVLLKRYGQFPLRYVGNGKRKLEHVVRLPAFRSFPVELDIAYDVSHHSSLPETTIAESDDKRKRPCNALADAKTKTKAEAHILPAVNDGASVRYLVKSYSPEKYPRYDNYDAIEVSEVSDIPCVYDGVMGVPVTFMNRYNPDQFEIVGADEANGEGLSCGRFIACGYRKQCHANGKYLYKRIFIRHRKEKR